MADRQALQKMPVSVCRVERKLIVHKKTGVVNDRKRNVSSRYFLPKASDSAGMRLESN